MKSFENYNYFIGGEGANNSEVNHLEEHKGAVKVTTAELCKTAINSRPDQGFTPEDMFNRLQVLGAIETQKNASVITLEDAQYNTLLGCVNNMKFAMLEAAFYHFIEQIKKAHG